uniref:Uncharacterized protein n=1 Tax=Utricularia reniformis TaxID=192314 RepID=A0A1Y0AZM6_9LAMI|nr:hypothetical protein AEK19_MT0364 [Utricularia reniformis]ART30636.1 hypothetical protein AEK19_MT0364 [Utricularia reniformis]
MVSDHIQITWLNERYPQIEFDRFHQEVFIASKGNVIAPT